MSVENMEIIFLAHDPGGYDVIRPVYDKFNNDKSFKSELMLTGVLGKQHREFALRDNDVLCHLLEKIKDNRDFILVTGTSWNSSIEMDALCLCKQGHITTFSILDYWSNYKNRFRRVKDYVFPDHFLVMDEMAKKEAIEEGIEERIIHIVGHPGLDYYVNKRIENIHNKKLLFLSQPLSALYGDSYGYTEFTSFEGVLKAGESLGYSVDIKFHPKETDEMMKKYAHFSVEGAIEELAEGYEAVIGMSTMGLLQLSIMRVPIISYQPEIKREDYCITNKLGITKGAYSYDDLIEQLKRLRAANQEPKYPFWYDGKSTERCCEYIKNAIKSDGGW